MVDEPLASTPSGVDEAAWDAACATVRAFCGWHVAPSVTQPMTVDGPGGSMLLLPTLHLTNVTSVTNDGTAVTDPEWSEAGMVRGAWSTKFRGVTLSMTHGYELCPDDVALVAQALALRVQANPESAVRVQRGPFSDQYEAGNGLTAFEKATLDRYRLPPRP